MRKRKCLAFIFGIVFILSMTVTTFAASFSEVWINDGKDWYVKNPSSGYLTNCWFCDDSVAGNGKNIWYLLGSDGKMIVAPLVKDGEGHYYSIETNHNGCYGMLRYQSGIYDGIYLELEDNHGGSFASIKNQTAIDQLKAQYGVTYVTYINNANAVYASGLSGTPNTAEMSGGGGGGGSGSFSGGNSPASIYHDYIISYISENGELLASEDGSAKKGSSIDIEQKSFAGYVYKSGAGKKVLSSNGQNFTVKYVVDYEYGKLNYCIRYIDDESGEVIKSEDGTGKSGTNINCKAVLDGYHPVSGNVYSFTLTQENQIHELRYLKDDIWYNYTIEYQCGSKTLVSIKGKDIKDSEVIIPPRDIPNHELIDSAEDSFILDEDGKDIPIDYLEASASEAEYRYSISYKDQYDDKTLIYETGIIAANGIIVPEMQVTGYEYMDDYEFTVESDGDDFVVYLINSAVEDDIRNESYSVFCRDIDSGDVVKEFTGRVSVGGEPVFISPDYGISGYRRVGDNEFYVERGGINEFYIDYERISEGLEEYKVNCIDVETDELIETVSLYGTVGQKLTISDICPDNYLPVGNIPDSVIISGTPDNNVSNLYYSEIPEIPQEDKKAYYVVHFVDKNDPSYRIKDDLSGEYTVGQRIPVYFDETYSFDGKIWKSIDHSPRTFEIKNVQLNEFTITFKEDSEIVQDDNTKDYQIIYKASDTGGTLGIAVGTGVIGEGITLRNTFSGYGYTTGTAVHELKEEDNTIEVELTRIEFPGYEVNPITQEYDGHEFLVVFENSEGEDLFPPVRAHAVIGDDLYIDYPDMIEGDGVTYRAVKTSPYHEKVAGTDYRQITIKYETGDTSENKLAMWEQVAQEQKQEFFGRTPYQYFIELKEKDSFNHIGLIVGVGKKNAQINMSCQEIDGYIKPGTEYESFVLYESGMSIEERYTKISGSSASYYPSEYTIHFIDADSEKEILKPLKVRTAFEDRYTGIEFPVYYPDSFYDTEGNRYEAKIKGPSTLDLSYEYSGKDYFIEYLKTYENDKTDCMAVDNNRMIEILSEFASMTTDSTEHKLTIIGTGFDPSSAQVTEVVSTYNLSSYSCEIKDEFSEGGVNYIIAEIRYVREWNEDTCIHDYIYSDEVKESCLSAGLTSIICNKCGKQTDVIIPAVGHLDSNHDSVCDRCEEQLHKQLGDEITVSSTDGDYRFVCIDDDYEGTGNQLYLCEELIAAGTGGYGTYSESESASYDSSLLRNYLDQTFASSLSIYNNLISIDGDKASILTKSQYDTYKCDSINKYKFPDDVTIITKGTTDNMILSDGSIVGVEQCDDYPIRPVILLKASKQTEGIVAGTWEEGDITARYINGRLRTFRCIDSNYIDKSNTDKQLALFICDEILPSSEGLGYDEPDGTQSTRFFGSNNNYKHSDIEEFLSNAVDRPGDLVTVNTGIDYEYTGETNSLDYEDFEISDFTAYKRQVSQYNEGKLFVPSIEEAVKYKNYLWCFNGSMERNPEEVIGRYSRSYWLRTPVNGTSNMIYTVDLESGSIRARSVGPDASTTYSDIGIRPMYAVWQQR